MSYDGTAAGLDFASQSSCLRSQFLYFGGIPESSRREALGSKVRSEIEARAARGKLFQASLFADPAWDILLELFAAELECRRVKISSAGGAAAVPLTTALRWISTLRQQGLVERTDDSTDARRSFLNLTEQGSALMSTYFEDSIR